MTENINFILNSALISTLIDPTITLLDFIREDRKLTGTKTGCREGDCGACTVLAGIYSGGTLTYKTVNSCLLPLGNIKGQHIVTIEGLSTEEISPVQKAFIEEGASQCGFCTPGFIVSLTGYLLSGGSSDRDKALDSIGGNICRCTGYSSIKRAADKVVKIFNSESYSGKTDIESLINTGLLPGYFKDIPVRLAELQEKPQRVRAETDKFIGGGTDLYVQQPGKLREIRTEFLKGHIPETIDSEGGICRIGGGTTFEAMNSSPLIQSLFPEIEKYFRLIASLPIRNSATIGGNIVNASPIGDTTIIFLALDAWVELNSGTKKRTLPLKELYTGYKTLKIEKGEYLEYIGFNIPTEKYAFNFEKVSKRSHLDIASVNSAAFFEHSEGVITNARISAGGVAPVPLFLSKSSEFLAGKAISYETLSNTLRIMQTEILPISDVRGSGEYKRLLLNQLCKAHFISMFPEIIKEEALL